MWTHYTSPSWSWLPRNGADLPGKRRSRRKFDRFVRRGPRSAARNRY